jgi:hypothetical protein
MHPDDSGQPGIDRLCQPFHTPLTLAPGGLKGLDEAFEFLKRRAIHAINVSSFVNNSNFASSSMK